MPEVPSLADRHDRWRRDSCLNLQPSENFLSPQVLRCLGSDLAARYTMPHRDGAGKIVGNDYGGTRYLDEIEATGEATARSVFHARHATLRPLSGHIAGMLLLLATSNPGDRILVLHEDDGGYNGYMPAGIPEVLGGRDVDFLPFRRDAWRLDTEASARAIRAGHPKLVVLGQSFFLFPHEIAPLREAADDAGARIGYDGSHVLGLIAGGTFQRPLEDGVDVLVGSTHKSLFGPQGGLLVTNDDDIWAEVERNRIWRLYDNAHWNRIAGLAQALAEHEEFGAAYARQVVRNAKSLADALAARGLPVKFADAGYTESHQIHLDGEEMKRATRMGPPDLSSALEANNLIVDRLGRIGTNEVTRLGAAEAEMVEIADLIDAVVRGTAVKEEVLALRSRLRIAYAFPD